MDAELVKQRDEMMFNPDAEFTDRFEAVMTDLLAGTHVNQLDVENSFYQEPVDNDEEPTNEF